MPATVEGRIDLLDPALESPSFRATNARGNSVLLGSTPTDPTQAEQWTGVSPMEVVLLGLGGCTGIDVVSTLRKARQKVTRYSVSVRGERRDEHPRIYTRIAVEHQLRGTGLRDSAVRRAIELSAETYCSVSAMLAASAEIEITYRTVDDATGAETTGAITAKHRR
ncbi:MAG TPA: OsmC family protein [Chloroflexota bacterium]|nr:OsmC family protein [Chloroflexota bacterium]